MLLSDDPRFPLAQQLTAYAANCPVPQQDIARQMLQFVLYNRDCFERRLACGHITGSAWLINPAGDKVLLTLHRKLRKWLQPGGHADGDADSLRVSLREATEESGISGIEPVSRDIFDVDIHAIPARPGEPEHLHYDVRYLLRTPHECFTVSEESVALAWFRFGELFDLSPALDDSVLRLARLWQAHFNAD